ncbi:MAG: TlpA disulfide reductase family protein [Flavobacteriaceae bacterium]
MKITKSQRSNLIFLIIIAIIFFTPLRGILQVAVSKAKMFILQPSIDDDGAVVANFDWKLKGINTADYDFESAKGKVVFINFWATWCPPCRAEMPSIQKLYTDYGDKVEFVFLTNEMESDKVNSFLDKNKYSLPAFNSYTNPPKEFNVSAIPATFILNKEGKIVMHAVGAVDWNSDNFRKILDELLAE